MTRLYADTLDDITFRQADTEQTRTQKLEFLRQRLVALGGTTENRTLYISIAEGLATAAPAEPLFRVRLREDTTLGDIVADAGNAATGTVAFRLFKNGVANGTISFTGTTGTGTVTDPYYPAGSLFELYPPTTADPTLDDVSISIPVSVG